MNKGAWPIGKVGDFPGLPPLHPSSQSYLSSLPTCRLAGKLPTRNDKVFAQVQHRTSLELCSHTPFQWKQATNDGDLPHAYAY